MSKSRKTKDYARRYGSALKGVPTLETKELAVKTKDGLKKIHPLDVKYEGSSFGLIRDLYAGEIKLVAELRNELDSAKSALTSTLIEKGYNTSNIELNSLIDDISHLLIIEPTKEYWNFTTNADGYIVGKQKIEIVTDGHIDIPDDFDKGYWRIVDGKFELDQEKYSQYWQVT